MSSEKTTFGFGLRTFTKEVAGLLEPGGYATKPARSASLHRAIARDTRFTDDAASFRKRARASKIRLSCRYRRIRTSKDVTKLLVSDRNDRISKNCILSICASKSRLRGRNSWFSNRECVPLNLFAENVTFIFTSWGGRVVSPIHFLVLTLNNAPTLRAVNKQNRAGCAAQQNSNACIGAASLITAAHVRG